MGAGTDSTPESPDDPVPTDDLPQGLRGLAVYKAKCEAWRFEYLKENPDANLPDPSDLEEFADEILTVRYGPPVSESIPEKYKGDRKTEREYRELWEQEAESKRRGAFLNLVRRFKKPMYKKRWAAVMSRRGLETLKHRTVLTGLTRWPWPEDPNFAALWWAGVGKKLEQAVRKNEDKERARNVTLRFFAALQRAVRIGLCDPKLSERPPEKIEGRLERAVANALAEDLLPDARSDGDPPGGTARDGTTVNVSDPPPEEDPLPFLPDHPRDEDEEDDEDADQGRLVLGYDILAAVDSDGKDDDDDVDPLERPRSESPYLERQMAAHRADEERPGAALLIRRILEELPNDEGERAVLRAVFTWRRDHPRKDDVNVSEAYREYYDPPAPEDDVVRRTFERRWKSLEERLHRRFI